MPAPDRITILRAYDLSEHALRGERAIEELSGVFKTFLLVSSILFSYCTFGITISEGGDVGWFSIRLLFCRG